MNNALDLRVPDTVSEDFINEIISEEAVADFEEMADEIGLSPEQAQRIFAWMLEGAARFAGELNGAAEEYCCESEKQLRSMFGREYEARQKAAVNLINKYGGEELVSFLRKSGIGNCREIVAFLMRLADAATEDRGLVGEKSAEFSTEDKIKSEIARLMAVPAYMQAQHPEHDTTVKQVYQLRRRLFNEE